MQKLKEKIDRKEQFRMWQTNVKLKSCLRQNSPHPFKFEESLRNYDNFPVTNNSLKRLAKQFSSPYPDSQPCKKFKTESGGKSKEENSKRKEITRDYEENIRRKMKESKIQKLKEEEQRRKRREEKTGTKQDGVKVKEEKVGKEKEKIVDEQGKKIEEEWISEEKSKSLEMTFRSVPSLTPMRYESDIKYPCRKFDFSELKEGLKTPEQIEANQFKEITMSEIKKDFEELGKEDTREQKRTKEKYEENETTKKWEETDKNEEDKKKNKLEKSEKIKMNTNEIMNKENEEFEEQTTIFENGEIKRKSENSSKKKKKKIETEDLHEYEVAKEEGGSFFKYSLMRASKVQKKKFGKETMIVPVRSSRRIYSKMNKSFNEISNVSLDLIGSEVGYARNEVESEFPPLDAEAEKLREFLHHKNIN